LLFPGLKEGWSQEEGQRLAKAVSIEAYEEAPILWPGFDGPVGLTVGFDLFRPEGLTALILPPDTGCAQRERVPIPPSGPAIAGRPGISGRP
jgi:hypothetical protein